MSRLDAPTDTVKEPLAADGMGALVVFAVLGGCVFGVAAGTMSLQLYAAAHVLCALGAAHSAWRSATPPRRQAVLLAVTTSALGPVGALGTLLSVCLEAAFRPYAAPFTDWYDRIFAEEDELENDAFLQRLAIGGDPVSGSIQLTSFRDILAFGTIEQKQAIIALIARRFTPAFAPALRLALEDPIAAVRVQAAAAAASIRTAMPNATSSSRATRSCTQIPSTPSVSSRATTPTSRKAVSSKSTARPKPRTRR